MTKQELMVQILHEVTGKPKKEVKKIFKAVRSALPDRGRKFDQTLTPAEATDLLTKLRAEKEGILVWLIQGGFEARLDLAAQRTPR